MILGRSNQPIALQILAHRQQFAYLYWVENNFESQWIPSHEKYAILVNSMQLSL